MSTTKAIHAKVLLPNSQCGGAMNSQAFGTWQAKKGEVYTAVKNAIACGYRTIDCAKIYRNQDEIGVAIQECITEGVCSRSDLFIISKVWNTDHAPEAVAASTKRTIADLQCGYLDLLLIHWPTPWAHPAGGVDDFTDEALLPKTKFVVEGKEVEGFVATATAAEQITSNIATYKAMERLVGSGLVKDIGLSNFNESEVQAILDVCTIKPAALQIELHPALPQEAMRAFCQKAGIVIMSYCPLAVGMGDPNASFLMHNADLQALARKAYGAGDEENGVSLCAKMLLQWNSQIGCICLSKSVTPSRIAANAAVPFGGLDAETMDAIKAWGQIEGNQLRVCCPPFRPVSDSVFPDASKIGWFTKIATK